MKILFEETENIKYLFLRFDIQDGERIHQHKVFIQTKVVDYFTAKLKE